MDLILGIDDAGRGPVIGPMAIAGVLIEESLENELRALGVKDSKQITPKRREFLADIIRKKSKAYDVILIFPEEIDESNKSGLKLNELEAIAAARIVDKLNKKVGNRRVKVVVDCPSPNIRNWTDFLKTKIDRLSNLEISCEHKADRNHIAVSAASILAKSAREEQVSIIKEKHGDIGSGYPSDPVTKEFLKKQGEKHKDSGIFRKSWSTWKNAQSEGKQTKLDF
jgi:ribonuclease HII